MVTHEEGSIITLLYKPSENDEERGSCLWARFYVDTERYVLMIDSDCGGYMHTWIPTPKTESFLHLLCRMNKHYLLNKLSDRTQIDYEATADEILEYVQESAAYEGIELEKFALQQIQEACYHHDSMQDLVAAVLDAIEERSFREMLSSNRYDLISKIEKDYPIQAKTIVSVFDNHIRPELRKLEDG